MKLRVGIFIIYAFQLVIVNSFSLNVFGSNLRNTTEFLRNGFGSIFRGANNSASIKPANSLIPFENQVAGQYKYFGENSRIGIMKQSKDYLLKPVKKPSEVKFYEFMKKTRNPDLEELKKYIPAYNGTVTLRLYDEDVQFLSLEDITKDFKRPCVMDLKIGLQTWEPDAPLSKIVEQSLQSPVMKHYWGFKICGLKYYNIRERLTESRNKEFYNKRFLFHEGVLELYNFVNGDIGIESGLVDVILEQLRKIRSWFQRQKEFLFFASSILFVYDADNILQNAVRAVYVDGKLIASGVRVRMIDFAHVVPNPEDNVDENYLTSLERLIYVFENLNSLYANLYKNSMTTRLLNIFSLGERFRNFRYFIGL